MAKFIRWQELIHSLTGLLIFPQNFSYHDGRDQR